jgi:hypothetical protein
VTLTAQEREALGGMIAHGKADACKRNGAHEAKLVSAFRNPVSIIASRLPLPIKEL